MTIDELKERMEDHREGLKGKTGSVVQFSETGPVGMSLMDAIVSVLEAQQAEIEELRTKIRRFGQRSGTGRTGLSCNTEERWAAQ